MTFDSISLGKKGELLASKYLRSKGYKLVERNYHCRLGEIDIIFKKGLYLIFVEVKTRRNIKHGYPLESIGKRKIDKLKKLSYYYIKNNNMNINKIRIEFVGILWTNKKIFLKHVILD